MRVPRGMRVLRGVLNAVFRTKLLFAFFTYVEYNFLIATYMYLVKNPFLFTFFFNLVWIN